MNTSNTPTAVVIENLKNTMEIAFVLVNPAERAMSLAEAGYPGVSASWRDPIAAVITDEELESRGITIQDVRDSVEFYTATEATITREQIKSTPLVSYLEPISGYLVIAKGYRAGPAGP